VPADSTCQSRARVLYGASSSPGAASSLLDIKNLTIEFGSSNPPARAIEDVCLTVQHGETVCLVGESGSGKSVTALSIARLLSSPPARYVQGEIWLDGHEILGSPEIVLRRLRGRIVSYVFQEPSASLNPVRTIGSQILEALKLHQPSLATREEVVRLLTIVGIPSPETRAGDYPHQMSGGMQQRAAIAMAIASRPKLLVADEPTTALDVTVQAQIIDLMRELQARLGMAILLITHNLGIVREIANRVAVIYALRRPDSRECPLFRATAPTAPPLYSSAHQGSARSGTSRKSAPCNPRPGAITVQPPEGMSVSPTMRICQTGMRAEPADVDPRRPWPLDALPMA